MVPVVNPAIVVVAVEPKIPPGFSVQFPVGNPLKVTFAVAIVQVGCNIVPTEGALGVMGCASITTLAEAKEVQPTSFVTE